MTSKEFYLKTSEMAYQVPVAERIDGENAVVAKMGPSAAKNQEEAWDFLDKNHFFALDVDTEGIDLGKLDFLVEFHYGVGEWDVFGIDVCDVIDCRDAGGRLVLSVVPGSAELIDEVRPEKDGEPSDYSKSGDKKESESIIDAIDRFFEGFDFPSLAKSLKDDKDSEFLVFSYKKDPDGNVKVTKTTRDGTVEKSFSADSDEGISADAIRELKKLL